MKNGAVARLESTSIFFNQKKPLARPLNHVKCVWGPRLGGGRPVRFGANLEGDLGHVRE